MGAHNILTRDRPAVFDEIKDIIYYFSREYLVFFFFFFSIFKHLMFIASYQYIKKILEKSI